jgi:hypothetical protein
MKKYLLNVALHALLGLYVQTASAAENLADNPGYLPLEKLFVGNQQPTVEVTLSGPVLKMLMQLPASLDEDDEDLQNVTEMLRVIDHIYVRVYEIDEDQQADMVGLIDTTSQKLEDEAWQRIVRVREEEDSTVDIHVKLSADGENLNGLAIMAVDDSNGRPNDRDRDDDGDNDSDGGDDKLELVIVNIVGNFNPAYLANIGKQMDIDYLDGVEVP